MSVTSYKTISASTKAELPKIKGSRFIAEAVPVSNQDDVSTALEQVRKREHAARHVCYAYRLGVDGAVFRSSDDGEPSGSAGKPILLEMESRNLTNVIVMVTRYFGGIKLGVGGLVRAYGGAAEMALDLCDVITRNRVQRLVVSYAYPMTSVVTRVLETAGAMIIDRRYSDAAEIEAQVKTDGLKRFRENLREATSGSVQVVLLPFDEKRDWC